MKKIVVAGGCFWGVEAYFRDVRGVLRTEVGYANGNKANPTYQEVCNGIANHAEATLIEYDENKVDLKTLFEHLFRVINPHSLNRQGNDIGVQYRTGIYYESNEDYEVAKRFLDEKQTHLERKITVELKPLTNYYRAEEYHQDYLIKNPNGYCHINLGLLKDDEKNEKN
ncbi:methionine-S-sulfoxide reductase [Acholeplasma morum]|uniref:peptide-methionine (S)-S-oxide reductase MsrA n=1 Tax=Paracholeplasma morum TaxID=264637 RepID=UPI0019577B87|nr:peptide-methionine (S)-S-oxide reductase MsrA [Paracholeplasma morum]MBM7453615.1 methionine-S-sulfoxide reductase [Paracholeplasma morum]